jgi:hypothetical protein
MVEMDPVEVGPEPSERVEILPANRSEVGEVDAELEGCVGGPHELGLVDSEAFDKVAQVRQSRLADADDADLGGFDQSDGAGVGKPPDQSRGRHPAGGAAAEDDDALHGPPGLAQPGLSCHSTP